MTNEKFLAFSPSDFSVSILTSSPLLSCHSGSTATTEIWRPIDFSRWLPRALNTTSGFVFVDVYVLAFRRSKFINKPNFVNINDQHIYGWDIKTSGLEKQTSTILEFTSGSDLDNFPVIWLASACRISSRIGAATAEIWSHIALSRWRLLNTYLQFRICWYRCLQKVKVYEQTKFRRGISIDGWDITTSVFEKQTSVILEIYFRFRFQPFAQYPYIILHQATEFRPSRSTHCWNMTSYPFLKMAAAAAEYYFRFRICWCRCLQ